jgi:hypothetical protein
MPEPVRVDQRRNAKRPAQLVQVSDSCYDSIFHVMVAMCNSRSAAAPLALLWYQLTCTSLTLIMSFLWIISGLTLFTSSFVL